MSVAFRRHADLKLESPIVQAQGILPVSQVEPPLRQWERSIVSHALVKKHGAALSSCQIHLNRLRIPIQLPT